MYIVYTLIQNYFRLMPILEVEIYIYIQYIKTPYDSYKFKIFDEKKENVYDHYYKMQIDGSI